MKIEPYQNTQVHSLLPGSILVQSHFFLISLKSRHLSDAVRKEGSRARPLLGLEAQAVTTERVGIGLSQHDAVPKQLEEDIIVAEKNEAKRQCVVPALRAHKGVELVQDHTGLDPYQQVENPQWLMKKKIKACVGHI